MRIARAIIGPRASAEQIAAFNHEYGLDRPLPLQFFSFLGQLLHGPPSITGPKTSDHGNADGSQAAYAAPAAAGNPRRLALEHGQARWTRRFSRPAA